MENEEFTIYRREESSECLIYAPTTEFGGYKELLRVEKELIELGFVITKSEIPYIQCIDTNYEGE